MAELKIGEHCSVETCKQLDFLPILCNGCGKVFCKEHMSYESHGCAFLTIPSTDHNAPSTYTGPRSFKCSFEKCSNREQTEIVCGACEENFCLAHRHQADHACKKLEPRVERMQQTALRVQEILSKPVETVQKPKPLSEKSKATAARVALMKLKQKAVGDKGIPDSERVFFNVILPSGSPSKTLAMFFSDKWYVGKAIDKLATAAALRNENNLSTAKHLCLFDSVNGLVCKSDQLIGDLIRERSEKGGDVFNGCTVILEYVVANTEQLESLQPYAGLA